MNRFSLIFVILTLPGSGIAAPTYENYTFTTFAGLAEAGPGWYDGSGSSARFNSPYAVALDLAGNVYVADTLNHTIRKITPTGAVSTLAGSAGAPGSTDGIGSAARFNTPTSLTVDSGGNVYVADTYNDTIRKITPAGVVTTWAGAPGKPGSTDGTAGAARFNQPYGIVVDSATNLYVSDTSNQTIRRITPEQVVTTLAGTVAVSGTNDGTGLKARFSAPCGICADSTGNLYVADYANCSIRKITSAGVVSTLAGNGSPGFADGTNSAAHFNYPIGIGTGGGGVLYVADSKNGTIRALTLDGAVTTPIGLAGVTGYADGTGSAARFNFPTSVGVDGTGNLYVADSSNFAIRKIAPGAVVTTLAGVPKVAGNVDGVGSSARFNNPCGLALDAGGNVYVTDLSNYTIRKITPSGVVTTLAGTPGTSGTNDGAGSAALFSYPAGAAVDNDTNVYVADTYNDTIRKITPAGIVTTLAGMPAASGTNDGSGNSARFDHPLGLAAGGDGTVYVADTYNHTIRKVTPAGVVTTIAGRAGVPGSTNGTGSAALFRYPSGLALDANTNLYIADNGNSTIRKITPGGVVTTLAGTAQTVGSTDGTGQAALFASPFGIAVDAAGNVFVSDSSSNVIRKITSTGVVHTVAGTPGVSGGAEGTGAAASFTAPEGIAVDPLGNVYVANSESYTIRQGYPALPDQAAVDLTSGAPGIARHFGVSNLTTVAWTWSIVRLPAASLAELSAATALTPSLTPDVADAYVVRFMGQDSQGRWALANLSLSSALSPPLMVTYTTNSGAITLTGYTGAGGDLTIPGALNGLPVTRIGVDAFNGAGGLTRVAIPAGLTNIGVSAFADCAALTAITVDASNPVYSSEDGVLFDATQATLIQYPPAKPGASYSIPSSVTNIYDQAFAGCAALTAITVDGSNPFYSSVDGVLFNKTQTTLIQYPPADPGGSYAIPNTVTQIGDAAFYGCNGLTNVTIPASVTSIGDLAFADCGGLSAIAVQSGNSFYASANGVLFNKTQTTLIQYPRAKAGSSYSIPASVTAIGDSAFYGSASLSSLTIPNSVTRIGDSAFEASENLTNLTLGNAVTNIGPGAFAGCAGLAAITAPAANSFYSSVDGVLYNKAQSTLLQYPQARLGSSYTIPATVTNIGPSAFDGCGSLFNVLIPNGVTSIGDSAFQGCGSLSAVALPAALTHLGNSAFEGCQSLTVVSIPNGVTRIGNSAFAGCYSLTRVAIGNSVTDIGDGAFGDCALLTSVMIPSGVVRIGNEAFEACTSLSTVALPATVSSIGDSAFAFCGSLTAITVDPGNPVYLDSGGVLFDKTQTTLVAYPPAKPGSNYTIPITVTHIDASAFQECYGLLGVYFQGNTPGFGSGVFNYDNNTTLYFLPGTTGWGPTMDGRPAVLWNPLAQTTGGSFGVRSHQFGFTVTGASNLVVVVEVCTNLVNPAWSPVSTNILTGGSSYFGDLQPADSSARFYRLIWP